MSGLVEAVSPTSVEEWKKTTGPQPQELPSGNTALLVRRPLPAMMKAGLVPNSLLPMIQESFRSGEKGPSLMESSSNNTEDIIDMFKMIDTITVEAVREPKVYPEPPADQERDPERLYVDEVDLSDKLFIYSYAIGAVDDLAGFRRQEAGDVEPVPDGSNVESAPERPDEDRG